MTRINIKIGDITIGTAYHIEESNIEHNGHMLPTLVGFEPVPGVTIEATEQVKKELEQATQQAQELDSEIREVWKRHGLDYDTARLLAEQRNA